MSNDVFILFSTAQIERDEYNGWLRRMNAVMKPDISGIYDARVSKDTRHVWLFLLEGESLAMELAEFEDRPEVLTNIRHLLGGEPRSAIELAANSVRGSKILAVQFAALCTEHYPCVVLQSAGNVVFPAHEVLELRDAGMGFDGFTWETADPTRSFSWDGLWMWDEPEDSLQDQMFVGSDTSEGRDKKQLGA
jgi:hypothetical protein